MKQVIYIFIVFLIILSCNTGSNKDEVLAKVYNEQLFRSDLNHLFEVPMSIDDSIKISSEFITKWTEDQTIIHESQAIKSINLDEINRKAEGYKNTLIIHQFENDYILKNLDTIISDNEIIAYYKSHQNDFQLNDYLVKVLYLKIPFDAPDTDQIDKQYALYKSDDIQKIEDYAKLYASNFYYDEENWMYFDDLTKEIPLKNINKDKFITRKSKIKIDENNFYYYLNVIDYKLKNTVSPIDFEKENIKQRILNSRIKTLRENIKTEFIQKANNEKAIKIY